MHGAVSEGSGFQHIPDCRLLLDPAHHPHRPLQLHLPRRLEAEQEIKGQGKESSINDVMQIWIIVDTPPPIVTLFITKPFVLLLQNP